MIFLGFWLLYALVQASDVPVFQASSPEWVWRWDNPWTLTAYRDDIANSTFFPTPQVFWNGTHWLDYVYEEHEDYYLLRNSHIAVEVYDYYAKFYDVNYSEVRLYDERWEVQRWRPKQGRWDDIGAQSGTPVFTVVTNESGVWLTKSFTSWAGVLNITYTLKVASPLKHTVTWKSLIAEETEFRIIQKWSGIVGGRVKHAQGEENVTGPVTVNSTWFRFMKLNGTFTVFQNLWDTGFRGEDLIYHNYVLQPTTIDVSAQGMKTDFTFQNSTLYTIPQGGAIQLDPTTSTWDSEAGKDGYICKWYIPGMSPTYEVVTSEAYIDVGQEIISPPAFKTFRGYVSFNTTDIPNNATILNATLKLKTKAKCSEVDFNVTVMGGAQPIYGEELEADDWDCGTTEITTWNITDYPGDNVYINFTISTDQINKWGRTQFELKSSREGTVPTGWEYVEFWSGDSSSDYVPKLAVTWHLRTENISGTDWYYLEAGNDKAAIVLFGGHAINWSDPGMGDTALVNYLYGYEEFSDKKDKFIEDLHASGFDVLTYKSGGLLGIYGIAEPKLGYIMLRCG